MSQGQHNLIWLSPLTQGTLHSTSRATCLRKQMPIESFSRRSITCGWRLTYSRLATSRFTKHTLHHRRLPRQLHNDDQLCSVGARGLCWNSHMPCTRSAWRCRWLSVCLRLAERCVARSTSRASDSNIWAHINMLRLFLQRFTICAAPVHVIVCIADVLGVVDQLLTPLCLVCACQHAH